MNRWNHYLAGHFAGCILIAEGLDQHRDREARAYIVPGDPLNFGITDGTDAWVIPIGAGAGGSIFKGIDIADLVRRHFAGEKVAVARVEAPRRRIFMDEPPAVRRRIIESSTEAPRRRHVEI